MKRMRRIVALLCAIMAFGLVGCGGGSGDSTDNNNGTNTEQPGGNTDEGGNTDDGGNTDEGGNAGDTTFEKNDVPVAENFDVATAIKNTDGWKGLMETNPVIDAENAFLTFRKKSNQAIGYETVGMSQGTMEFKMKVSVKTDTTACLVFSNQAKEIEAFCYKAGGKSYALEFSGVDSKVYLKKWVNGVETKLTGTKSQSSIPMTLGSKFTDVKLMVEESADSVRIEVYVGGSLTLNVEDTDNPILGGGAVGFSYMGAGGMVITGKDSDTSKYQEPEDLGLTKYDAPNVEVATGTVDLMADFEANWTGRNRIYNKTIEESGAVKFESLDNPEEPQGGVTEYQALYKSKAFATVQYEYDFNVISHGEWIMFWFKCMPENDTTDVSIWGNKGIVDGKVDVNKRQNTNGYSVVITADGYVQVHKWADFGQMWLNGQGTKLPGATIAKFADPAQTIKLKMSMEAYEDGGQNIVEFRIKVGDATTIVVEDTEDPFTNAGYAGLQGYAIGGGKSSIRLLAAKAYDEITL